MATMIESKDFQNLLQRVEKLEERFKNLVTNHSQITNDYKSYSLEQISVMWDEVNTFRDRLGIIRSSLQKADNLEAKIKDFDLNEQ